MKLIEKSLEKFPKWHLTILEDFPENYHTFISSNGQYELSYNVFMLVYKDGKQILLSGKRIKSINKLENFYWVTDGHEIIDSWDVVMWCYLPSIEYLNDEYQYWLELSETVQLT